MSISRSLWVLASLVVSQSVMADASTPVTVDGSARTVSAVVKDLAQKASLNLEATGTIASDVVFVSVKDQPASDVMKRLADALHAEWQSSGATSYLVRTDASRRAQERLAAEDLAKKYKTEVDAAMAVVSKLPKFDSDQAQKFNQAQQDAFAKLDGSNGNFDLESLRAVTLQSPTNRGMIQLLSKMDMREFGNIPIGGRKVFSIQPNSMQRPLPNLASSIAQTIVMDSRILADASGTDSDNARIMSIGSGISFTSARPRAGNVANVLLVAIRPSADAQIELELQIFGEDGAQLFQSQYSLGEAPQGPQKPEFEVSQPAPLEYSTLNYDYAKAIQSPYGGSGGMIFVVGSLSGDSGVGFSSIMITAAAPGTAPESPRKPLSPELLQIVSHPDQYEPQNYFVAQGLNTHVKATGANMIAVLPDSLFYAVGSSITEQRSTTKAFFDVLQQNQMRITSDSGWLTVTPKDFSKVWSEHVDRKAVAAFLQAIVSRGAVTLSEKAAYATRAPIALGFRDLDLTLGCMISPSATTDGLGFGFEGGDRESLRFFGLLGDGQRQAVIAGNPLQIAGMNADQRTSLERIVFWSADGPHVTQPTGPGGRGPGGRGPGGRGRGPGGPGLVLDSTPTLSQERTYVLSSGLPGVGFVRISVDKSAAILARKSGQPPTFMDSSQAANMRIQQDGLMPQFGGIASSAPPTYDEFKGARQIKYTLSFQFSPRYGMDRMLKDNAVDAAAGYGPYSNLPADVQKEIQDRYDEIKKILENVKIGGQDGNIP